MVRKKTNKKEKTMMEAFKRLVKDWHNIAGEKVELEDTKGSVYAFGSEVAMYRLLFEYTNGGRNNPNGKFKVGYSQNLEKWFFRLER